MCGIVGGFSFRKQDHKYIGNIDQALRCISHRGPDGDGIYRNEHVALGHKRLSIIDTSAVANQPMYSPGGKFCIVYNGEIFNYKQLKEEHLPDYAFTTSSDTEVVLQLFIKYGTDCFAMLRGFFALAIYDTEKDILCVARDRFGKKPVHVYRDQDAVLFSSELKSLISFGIPKEINWHALAYYFQLNYIPQPLSILQKVDKLLPGHFMEISKEGIKKTQYYQLNIATEKYWRLSYDEAKTKLVDLMDKATELRLISDVPLGAFLSGGIDSSVVVALASRHTSKLKTFSIGYKDNPFFDETAYANLVAKKYDTEHTVFSLSNNDFLEHIEDVLNYMDEPFADSSSIPSFILSKQTRKHVTVALSGDGGDEVFAGYNKYNAELNASTPSVKRSLVKGLAPLWKLLPKSRDNKITNRFRQLHRFAGAAGLSADERYWRWASMMPAEKVDELFDKQVYQSRISKREPLGKLFNYNISGKDLNEVLLADMNLVLVSDMLVKVDLMSMANSLEIRSPFLDQEVVEFAFGLPAEYKIDANMKKKIVQDSFRDLLPAELYNRPKQGFDIPLLGWFRKELWNKIDKELLSDSFIKEQGIFDAATIGDLKRKLQSNNPEDSHETIWALLVFQHWWKKYIAE